MRQSIGFELVKCNPQDKVRLISNINVTDWHDIFEPEHKVPNPCIDIWPFPEGPDKNFSSLRQSTLRPDLWHAAPLHADPLPFPTFPRERYSAYSNWTHFEWLRSTSQVYSNPGESHVKLDTSSFVTTYGRRGLPDHAVVDIEGGRRGHRLWNLTSEAAADVRKDVEGLFEDADGRQSSGIDWRQVADDVVQTYGNRLREIYEYLVMALDPKTSRDAPISSSPSAPISESANTTSTLLKARFMISSLLMPHLNLPSASNTSHAAKVVQCVESHIPSPLEDVLVVDSKWTSQEMKINRALVVVQSDICSTLLEMNESLDHIGSKPFTPDLKTSSDPRVIRFAKESIGKLMARLDWSTWVRCKERCGLSEVCMIDTWPWQGESNTGTLLCLSERTLINVGNRRL